MVEISLTQSIMRDPGLRESLRSAQTREQQLHILENAGFSRSKIDAARQTAKFATHMYQGKLSSWR